MLQFERGPGLLYPAADRAFDAARSRAFMCGACAKHEPRECGDGERAGSAPPPPPTLPDEHPRPGREAENAGGVAYGVPDARRPAETSA